MINKRLKQKILQMVDEDQTMRVSGKWDSAIDKKNTKLLKEIIKKYGWPTQPLVGKMAVTGSWLIAQHADHDVDFQRQCLKLMRDSNHPSNDIAYLTDRVLVNERKKQLYGTQFYLTKNKRFIARPIKDYKNLEKRRRSMGLESFKEYKIRLTEINKKYKKR